MVVKLAETKRGKKGNPKGNPENLKRYGKEKPPNSHEQSVKNGKKAGKASAESRRRKITMDEAFYTVINKAVKGDIAKHMKSAGFEPEEIDNAHAVLMTLLTLAVDGDKDAIKMVLEYQKSLTEDARKSEESRARIESMKASTGTPVAVQSNDENNGGVVIYLPALEEDEPEEIEEEEATEATPVEEG